MYHVSDLVAVVCESLIFVVYHIDQRSIDYLVNVYNPVYKRPFRRNPYSLNLYTERLSDAYDPNELLWSSLAYDGIWALALCLNKSIPSNALQDYSVGDYHNTKLIRECLIL